MNNSDKHSLNILNSRSLRPYSRKEYFFRILWALFSPLFRFSPRNFFNWRVNLLRLFGAKIGKNVHIYSSAKIYLPWNLVIGDEASIGEWVLIYNLGKVKIGSASTISHRAHICAGTHDYQDPNLPLLRLPIDIGPEVWVCSDVFIGPSVVINEGAIVAAGSVVVKHVNSWEIVGGNPAKFIKKRLLKTN